MKWRYPDCDEDEGFPILDYCDCASDRMKELTEEVQVLRRLVESCPGCRVRCRLLQTRSVDPK